MKRTAAGGWRDRLATDRHEILSKIDAKLDIPALPEVVGRMLEMLDSKMACSEEIGECAAQDPAIAARLLRSANSAFYARPGGDVRSIHDAVVRLGQREVRNMVLSLGVIDAFGAGSSVVSALDVWRHSLTAGIAGARWQSARASRAAARPAPMTAASSPACFTTWVSW